MIRYTVVATIEVEIEAVDRHEADELAFNYLHEQLKDTELDLNWAIISVKPNTSY